MTEKTNLTNHFLIASPKMEDANFSQAVIYICEHSDNGALGIIINHPTSVRLSEILEQMKLEAKELDIANMTVLYGGPVHQERGFVIHRAEPNEQWRSSLKPADDIVVTTSRDILEAIAEGRGPHESVVALGYAGWEAGQLEQELASNTWLNCQASKAILFETPFEQRWEQATRLLGIHNIHNLSDHIGHA